MNEIQLHDLTMLLMKNADLPKVEELDNKSYEAIVELYETIYNGLNEASHDADFGCQTI